MKSNKKIVFVCSAIIILGILYLVLSGKVIILGNKTVAPAPAPVKIEAPLSISGTVVKNITSTEATIEWKTNTGATSQISYGTIPILKSPTKSYEFSTSIDQKIVTDHSLVLKNLKAKTQIFYQIISSDSKGQKFPLFERSFSTRVSNNPIVKTTIVKTTTPVTHTTVPTPVVTSAALNISAILAKNINSSGATITWKTNIPATSQVLYGTASGIYLSSTTLDNTLNTIHSVALGSLLANKKIFYQVVSVDGKGNKVISNENSFQVATISISGAPTVVFNSSNVGVGATIFWKTNVASTSQVIYGAVSSSSGAYDSNPSMDNNLISSHSFKLTNLNAGTKFYYRIISTDTGGAKLISQEYTFTTPMSSNINESVSYNSVTIQWTTAIPTTSKVIFGTISGSYPLASPLISTLTTYHIVTINRLQPSTKYFYEVVSGVSNSEEHSFINP